MARIIKIEMLNIGEELGQPALPYIAGASVKWYNHYEKLFGSFH